jgi:hypothetical protein
MKPGPAAFMIPRLRDLLFGAVFAAVLMLGPRMLNIDSDLGRHLTLGNYILEHGRIPVTDLFSHTMAGQSRPPYEWLAQAIFAFADRLGGLDFVILTSAAVIAAAFAVLYSDAARRTHAPLTALAIVMLAAAAASLHWLPRPHIFTFALLAIWLERLERVWRGEQINPLQFAALMLVWANVHGGFVFGFLAWLAYLAGWAWTSWREASSLQPAAGRKLLAIGLLSLIASILTPDGWGNWQAVLGNHSRYILSRTVETMQPDFSVPNIWPFALLLALTVILPVLGRKLYAAPHLLLLAGFATMALLMTRNIPLFAIAAAPVLAESAALALARRESWNALQARVLAVEDQLRGALWPVVLICVGAILFSIHLARTKQAYNHFDPAQFPVAAADWLASNPQTGEMFNDFNWGGYLLLRLWPAQRVFLDSQTDFYGEDLVRTYDQIDQAAPGWEAQLSEHGVDWAILPPDAPVAVAMSRAGWQVLYQDSTTAILRTPK